VLSQKISLVLPGPRNVKELSEALAYESASQSDLAPPAIGDELHDLLRGQCTVCNHCLPCPVGIKIPTVVTSVNYLDYFAGTPMSADHNRNSYQKMEVKASECTECGICEERCPFDVEVVGKMHRAVELFENAG
jgi:predicted aldo/keto reductase-like oxidoreductase